MRILFVSRAYPIDFKKKWGIYKRMQLFIDAIKEFSHIDMLYYIPYSMIPSEEEFQEEKIKICNFLMASVHLYLCPLYEDIQVSTTNWSIIGRGVFSFYNQAMHIGISRKKQISTFNDCLKKKEYDAIFVHRLNCSSPVLQYQKKLPPVFFDIDDIEHIAFVRNLSNPPFYMSKLLYHFQVPALFWGERKMIALSRLTFACSDKDRDYLNKFQSSTSKKVITIPNAIEIPEQSFVSESHTILFIGILSYLPNIIAVEYLIEKIFPRIRETIPDVKLIIAGKYPENIKYYGKKLPGIEFPGYVKDLNALYQSAQVICSPMFSGGGTRLKIIEAAAFGKAIVANKLGAEGLVFKDGKNILLRENPQAFAEACIALLKQTELCQKIGDNARKIATQNYDKDNIVQKIKESIFKSLGSN